MAHAVTGNPNDYLDIYIARVGRSESMAHGIIAGTQIDSPLSEEGQKSASEAGNTLVRIFNEKTIKKVQIATADEVARMKQTTDYIVQKLEAADVSYRRQSEGVLGGKDHGIFNGSSKEERRQKEELVDEKALRQQMTPEMKFKTAVKGGESKSDIVTKVQAFFNRFFQGLELRSPAEPLVVVTSNNTVEAFTALLNKDQPYTSMKMGYSDILHLRQFQDRLEFVQIIKA